MGNWKALTVLSDFRKIWLWIQCDFKRSKLIWNVHVCSPPLKNGALHKRHTPLDVSVAVTVTAVGSLLLCFPRRTLDGWQGVSSNETVAHIIIETTEAWNWTSAEYLSRLVPKSNNSYWQRNIWLRAVRALLRLQGVALRTPRNVKVTWAWMCADLCYNLNFLTFLYLPCGMPDWNCLHSDSVQSTAANFRSLVPRRTQSRQSDQQGTGNVFSLAFCFGENCFGAHCEDVSK